MYNYHEHRKKVFTEEGQLTFLAVRDAVHNLIDIAGAARVTEIIKSSKSTDDTDMFLACIDRLVELREIQEVTESEEVMGQKRIFEKYDQ